MQARCYHPPLSESFLPLTRQLMVDMLVGSFAPRNGAIFRVLGGWPADQPRKDGHPAPLSVSRFRASLPAAIGQTRRTQSPMPAANNQSWREKLADDRNLPMVVAVRNLRRLCLTRAAPRTTL